MITQETSLRGLHRVAWRNMEMSIFGGGYFPGLFIIIGILIICVASSFYMTADIGVSTYDAVALIISNTWHIGKFKYVRIVTDVICVILGVMLYFLSGAPVSGIGAVVGAGTIITAFFMEIGRASCRERV